MDKVIDQKKKKFTKICRKKKKSRSSYSEVMKLSWLTDLKSDECLSVVYLRSELKFVQSLQILQFILL